MNSDDFLGLLNKRGFPQPSLVKHEGGKFLDFQSHPLELLVLVIEGQVDITNDGHRVSYLAGDFFYIPANQIHSKSFGSKGVSYLMSCKGEFEDAQVTPQA
jgi:quercetin dioxygenase-like cupin family protein